MHIKSERAQAVESAIAEIDTILAEGITVDGLNLAKQILLRLAEQHHLFTHNHFPLPSEGEFERTYLIYEDVDGSNALYVNSGIRGQQSPPHDHGGAWAIIVAVEGEEIHRLYACEEADSSIHQVGEIVVKPGQGVSMMPEGIHAIEAVAEAPLLHLHLYGIRFADQGERRQFDLASGNVRRFVLDDVGFLEDAR